MANLINELEELCEKATDTIAEANKKYRANGTSVISSGDADYLDKLTHMVKSIKTILAMDEYEDDYSNSYGQSYRGDRMPYARGRVRNARRDSMGRYSRNGGYSYHDGKEDFMEELNDIMQNAPDDRYRQEIRKMMDKLNSM